LPKRPRGYYHEYTVKTPGVPHRGVRRIISGGVNEYYYTADHYKTFARIKE
jgi:ribonuclease T1